MASTATVTPVPTLVLPNLGPTLGALYLGGMGAAVLFGATNLQIYFYFMNYKQSDGVFQKCSILFLWLLDTLHTAFAIAEIWHYLIRLFGNYSALAVITWTYKVQISIMIIIILLVQSLYTLRVWKLSRDQNRLWPWILIIALIGGYAAGITLMVETYRISLFTELSRVRWSIYLSFSMATFNDLMLAVGMCHILYLGTTVFAETKSMLGIMVRYIIVSGALTSMCSIAGLTTFFVMPDNFVFLGIALVLSKLYINSYLAMMNARKSIRNTATNIVQLSDIEARVQNMDFQTSAFKETGSQTSGVRDKVGRGVKVRVDVIRQREESILGVRRGDP